ncbi:hypothetical protein Nmel_012682 [Mimus melanotis]
MLPVVNGLPCTRFLSSFLTLGNGICVGRKLDPWDAIVMEMFIDTCTVGGGSISEKYGNTKISGQVSLLISKQHSLAAVISDQEVDGLVVCRVNARSRIYSRLFSYISWFESKTVLHPFILLDSSISSCVICQIIKATSVSRCLLVEGKCADR